MGNDTHIEEMCPFMQDVYKSSIIKIDEKIILESKFKDITDQIVNQLYQEYSKTVMTNDPGTHTTVFWPTDTFSNRPASPLKVAMALWAYTNAFAGFKNTDTVRQSILKFRGIKKCCEVRDTIMTFQTDFDICPSNRVEVYAWKSALRNTQMRTGHMYTSKTYLYTKIRQTSLQRVGGLFRSNKQITQYLENTVAFVITKFLSKKNPTLISQIKLILRRL